MKRELKKKVNYDRLKRHIEKQGVSLEKFAEIADLPCETVWKIKREGATLTTLEKINLAPEYLVEDECISDDALQDFMQAPMNKDLDPDEIFDWNFHAVRESYIKAHDHSEETMEKLIALCGFLNVYHELSEEERKSLEQLIYSVCFPQIQKWFIKNRPDLYY